MPRPQQSQAQTSAKRKPPVPVKSKPAPRKRALRTTPHRTSTRNHKSAEARLERDALDEKVIRLLSQKKHQADGLLKADIASETGSDASHVKASLNRLVEMKLVQTIGATMNTKYVAVKDAVGKLKEVRRAKDKPAKKDEKTPVKRSSKRPSPAQPAKQTAKTNPNKDDEE